MCFDFAWNSLSGLFFCSRCCFSFSLDEINDWIFDWTYGIQYRIRTQVLCGWPAIFGRQSSTFLLCSFTLTFVLVLGLGSFLVFVRTHSHSRTHTFEKGPYCSFDMLFVASKTAPFDAWAKSRLVGALKFFKQKALKRIFRKYYWSRYELRCNHSVHTPDRAVAIPAKKYRKMKLKMKTILRTKTRRARLYVCLRLCYACI